MKRGSLNALLPVFLYSKLLDLAIVPRWLPTSLFNPRHDTVETHKHHTFRSIEAKSLALRHIYRQHETHFEHPFPPLLAHNTHVRFSLGGSRSRQTRM